METKIKVSEKTGMIDGKGGIPQYKSNGENRQEAKKALMTMFAEYNSGRPPRGYLGWFGDYHKDCILDLLKVSPMEGEKLKQATKSLGLDEEKFYFALYFLLEKNFVVWEGKESEAADLQRIVEVVEKKGYYSGNPSDLRGKYSITEDGLEMLKERVMGVQIYDAMSEVFRGYDAVSRD